MKTYGDLSFAMTQINGELANYKKAMMSDNKAVRDVAIKRMDAFLAQPLTEDDSKDAERYRKMKARFDGTGTGWAGDVRTRVVAIKLGENDAACYCVDDLDAAVDSWA